MTELLPGLLSPLEQGEPIFVLRARDKLASPLVKMWALISEGNTNEALMEFAKMVEFSADNYLIEPRSFDKVSSANEIANEMVKFYNARRI